MSRAHFGSYKTIDTAKMTTDTSIEELDTRSTRVSATDAANIPPLAAHTCLAIFLERCRRMRFLGRGASRDMCALQSAAFERHS